ncbi:beta-galactosidase [Pelomonas sp. Root1217]|uniref:beta-galactosidase GalA n=1 Tax=Pelomonas sp. Root1217 TaxID=1736430 RepID=UPI00070C9848|nr:beta-galactosidase GalA [Pelomonas sp. Root1217]KQV47420.1 beta-galactosidase [Pelomonas sp. Root1217]
MPWRRVLLMILLAVTSLAHASPRERLSLDQGWLFHLGDVPTPPIKGHGASYNSAKAGGVTGAAATDFDDSSWRRLDLPHDWAVEGGFDANENLSQGYRKRGIGWYRRYFQLPASDRGRHIELQFDAIATHSTVWVNGIVVNRNWSGYNGRNIDITPYLRYGEDVNNIAVRVDADAMEGWWYEGAGIYRHTWLVKRDAVHIATDGIHANPVSADGNRWSLPVEIEVNSSGRTAQDAEVDVSLIDPAGKEVARARSRVRVKALGSSTAKLQLAIKTPQLWTLKDPRLYRVRAQLRSAGQALDEAEVQTGFRTIRFDADKGFFLNGLPVKLQGVCIHQDHAGVGVAVPEAIWAYRLRRLKDMGVNAIRFAHNAPAAEVLDLVDRMGFLVMDENRNFNPSRDYLEQLTWLVKRDRNHPSVVLWSVFNEEPMQGTEVGFQMVRRMVAAVKELDSTRPVTAAMNGGLFSPINVSQAVDVVGLNYQIGEYDRFHKANPKLPLTSSEDTSAFMSRGEFKTDQAAHLMASDDSQAAYWGNTHRQAWKAIAERPFIAGGFVWTGFDYRGEPTPFEWPSASSVFGAMDLCGFAKTAFWLHRAQWVKLEEQPVVKIAPHWNWPGQEGKQQRVMVLSNAPRVRLLLNGKVLDERDVDPFEMVTFDVAYAPGKLEAVALKGDIEIARDVVETSGAPVRLLLAPDRTALAGDGLDAMPVTVSALDAQGRFVPTANLKVRFELSGAASVIGVGNGDANSHESEKASERSLYNGLAQVILQSRRDGSGEARLRALADGLQPAEITLALQTAATPPAVAVAEPVTQLLYWRISPAQAAQPDPNVQLADNDMNTWGWGEVPIKQAAESPAWRLYRTDLRLRADLNDGSARLVFRELAGKAQVWLAGVKLGEKTTAAPAEFSVLLSKGATTRQLTVMVQSDPTQPSGLLGKVVVQKP